MLWCVFPSTRAGAPILARHAHERFVLRRADAVSAER